MFLSRLEASYILFLHSLEMSLVDTPALTSTCIADRIIACVALVSVVMAGLSYCRDDRLIGVGPGHPAQRGWPPRRPY